jgi:hypothetical protein
VIIHHQSRERFHRRIHRPLFRNQAELDFRLIVFSRIVEDNIPVTATTLKPMNSLYTLISALTDSQKAPVRRIVPLSPAQMPES